MSEDDVIGLSICLPHLTYGIGNLHDWGGSLMGNRNKYILGKTNKSLIYFILFVFTLFLFSFFLGILCSLLSLFYILYFLSISMYQGLTPPFGLAAVCSSPIGSPALPTLTPLLLPLPLPRLVQPIPIFNPTFPRTAYSQP
jgi:hypothetical protein